MDSHTRVPEPTPPPATALPNPPAAARGTGRVAALLTAAYQLFAIGLQPSAEAVPEPVHSAPAVGPTLPEHRIPLFENAADLQAYAEDMARMEACLVVHGYQCRCLRCMGCTSCTGCTSSCTGCTGCTGSTCSCTGCTSCTGSTSAPLPPHVRRGADEKLHPEEGYTWVDPNDKDDLRVKPVPEGTPHPRFPHVVFTGDGVHIRPEEGYTWDNIDARTVKPLPAGTPHPRYPHVVFTGEGDRFRPEEGYGWDNIDARTVKPLPKGTPHDRYPHVVWKGDGRTFEPADGYEWVDAKDNKNMAVRPVAAGTPHERLPNVVWSGDSSSFHPAPGFRWAHPENPKDFSVELRPGLAKGADGKIQASPGYHLVHPNDPKDLTVALNPGLVVQANGGLAPAPGYRWKGSDHQKNPQVEPIPAGTPHESLPHVVWAGDGKTLAPAPGYQFIAKDPAGSKDFSAQPTPQFSAVKTQVEGLLDGIQQGSLGDRNGVTRTIYLPFDGGLVPFTVLPHPKSDREGTALEQLQSVAAASQSARTGISREDRIDRLSLGFDTPAAAAGSLRFPVLTSKAPPPPPRPTVPAKYAGDDKIKQYLATRAEAETAYAKAGEKIREIEVKMREHPEAKAELQVQTVQVLTEMAVAKSTRDAVDINIKERVELLDLSFKPGGSLPLPSPDPGGTPGGAHRPEPPSPSTKRE